MRDGNHRWSRRSVLGAGAATLAAGAAFSGFEILEAAAQTVTRTKIRDVQTMIIQGPRTYTYVRIVTDDGHSGIAEGYGSPGVGVAEQILAIKPWLVGKDPLEIDRLYTMLDGGNGAPFTRTDGSAHQLMRAASAIEMALWDLAGNILGTPVSVLLGGQFRDHVRVYDHARPDDMFSRASCREWAAKVRAHPSGFTAHKIGTPHTDTIFGPQGTRAPNADPGRDLANRQLSTRELIRLAQGFENIREAIGWDHDIMVHCHWEYDLRTSLELAKAIAPIRPMWLEDPLTVDYSNSWQRLVTESPVPILMGENLTRREGFAPFIVNQACDIVNPDLRNSGGFLETKRIADLASIYGIPMSTHNTSSQLHSYQICQWASSIRDFLISETVTGEGGWMDQVLMLDGPYIRNGFVAVHNRPGTGVRLNKEVVQAHLVPGQQWWGDL